MVTATVQITKSTKSYYANLKTTGARLNNWGYCSCGDTIAKALCELWKGVADMESKRHYRPEEITFDWAGLS